MGRIYYRPDIYTCAFQSWKADVWILLQRLNIAGFICLNSCVVILRKEVYGCVNKK